ncbi:MAG: tyrosine-type recombinase/integrase, partial [Bacteroidota bacterium]
MQRAITNIKHRAIIALVYSAGLRRNEILNLRIKDVLFSRKCIFVKSAKGNKDRYVLLSEKAATITKAYLSTYSPKYWLFEGEKGG